MLFCIGFQSVSVLCRQKHIFRKCTKILSFCIVFEDRPFWLQHQNLLKFQWKKHRTKPFFFLGFGKTFCLMFRGFWHGFGVQNRCKMKSEKGSEMRTEINRAHDCPKTATRRPRTPQDASRPPSLGRLGPTRGPKIDLKSIRIRS